MRASNVPKSVKGRLSFAGPLLEAANKIPFPDDNWLTRTRDDE